MKGFGQKLLFYLALVICVSPAVAGSVKEMHMSENMVTPVSVSKAGVVLSFLAKPEKVVLGNAQAFHIEYVERDLAISPVLIPAQSFLHVYMLGRRFSFDLRAVPYAGQPAVLKILDVVEDSAPKKQKVTAKKLKADFK